MNRLIPIGIVVIVIVVMSFMLAGTLRETYKDGMDEGWYHCENYHNINQSDMVGIGYFNRTPEPFLYPVEIGIVIEYSEEEK